LIILHSVIIFPHRPRALNSQVCRAAHRLKILIAINRTFESDRAKPMF